tara:strand:+ start:28 stop:330 length:303 start_codon:yes stop_codon:yes gene_type:complete
MGKKRTRATQTSKGGLGGTISKKLKKQLRREYKSDLSSVTKNKLEAFFKGKNVMITIPNPTKAKNMPFVRVRMQDAWFGGRDYKTVLAGPKRKRTTDEAD